MDKESRKIYMKEYHKKHDKEYREKNKERISQKSKEYRARNKEELSKKRKEKYHGEYAYNLKLKNTYGITLADYNKMFEEQNGCCKICNISQLELKSKLHVDHNHETGEVRGLLCSNCNTGIGLLNDNVVILQKAIEYLQKSNKK